MFSEGPRTSHQNRKRQCFSAGGRDGLAALQSSPALEAQVSPSMHMAALVISLH